MLMSRRPGIGDRRIRRRPYPPGLSQGALPMPRLANKSAVVTGAANGIGRAIALRFAEEGARQALVDIDRAGLERVVAEIARSGGEAHPVVADVTEEAPATGAIQGAIERFGTLDVLVNKFGGGRHGRVWEIS